MWNSFPPRIDGKKAIVNAVGVFFNKNPNSARTRIGHVRQPGINVVTSSRASAPGRRSITRRIHRLDKIIQRIGCATPAR